MNSKVIAIVAAIIVIAGGAFYYTRSKSDDQVASETNTAATADESADQDSVETASIKSLMESGSSRQCNFSTIAEGSETTGTVYVAGGKMRGDFNVMTKEATVLSHTIFDGSTSYLWTDNAGEGIKMNVDPTQVAESQQNQSVDVNKNFEFDCHGWAADGGKFVPPADVKFNEMPTVPAAGATPGAADTKEMQQAMCNNLPEPAKSSCLSGIK